MRGEAGWRQRNVHQGLKRQLTDSKTEPNVGTLWSEGEHTLSPWEPVSSSQPYSKSLSGGTLVLTFPFLHSR